MAIDVNKLIEFERIAQRSAYQYDATMRGVIENKCRIYRDAIAKLKRGEPLDSYVENLIITEARMNGFPVDGGYSSSSYSSSVSSSSGGCFIATAAYGSYFAPEVLELRSFRDYVLLPNPLGRLFVSAYYKVSPPVANLVAKSAFLKSITRLLFLEHLVAMTRPLTTKARQTEL